MSLWFAPAAVLVCCDGLCERSGIDMVEIGPPERIGRHVWLCADCLRAALQALTPIKPCDECGRENCEGNC